MTEPAVEVLDIHKSYGAVEAVRGISFTVAEGEVFALLGPNGAGKTTTVEICEGHRTPTSGTVRVLGADPARGGRALRERMGIVLQRTGVEPYLTVEETVALFGSYYPRPRPVDEVLSLVGLAEQRRTRVRRLSGGQQRRLDVAVGLAGDPDLLFLDEPTTGFDPAARRSAWDMIRNLRSLGKTVLLTTHAMDEAQHLADRVAILVRGRIVAEGPPGMLSGRAHSTTIRFRLPARAPGLPAVPGDVSMQDREVTIRTQRPVAALNRLTGWALQHEVDLPDLTVLRPSLEDVYLEVTGGESGTEGA